MQDLIDELRLCENELSELCRCVIPSVLRIRHTMQRLMLVRSKLQLLNNLPTQCQTSPSTPEQGT